MGIGIRGGKAEQKKPGKKGLTAGLRVPTWVMERRSRYYLTRGCQSVVNGLA